VIARVTLRRKTSGAKAIRRRLTRLYRRMTSDQVVVERGRGWVSHRGSSTVLLQRGGSEPRRGIFMRGACDAPALFTLAPMLIGDLAGSLCIHQSGMGVSGARSDLLLQTHAGVPADYLEEVRARFDLPRDYFAATLFESTFTPRGFERHGAFPKSVIVLSVLPDLTRTIYRDRERGYLVDPGTAWLNNKVADALADLSFVGWFREHFEQAGRISVEDFRANYGRLIPLIKWETGAHVLVFNTLEIEPLDATHDYSLRNLANASRRRRFNIALAELSRELVFEVVDVDRVLKGQGVEHQVDFSHFPVDRMRAVASEVHRILRELEVV
jgi:hypothetical protein